MVNNLFSQEIDEMKAIFGFHYPETFNVTNSVGETVVATRSRFVR